MSETEKGINITLPVIPAVEIRNSAVKAGFTLCGIAPYRRMPEQLLRLERWLNAGKHGNLGYMERNAEKRADPSALFPDTRSVIVCAVNYRNKAWDAPRDGRPKIASYAWSKDYHSTIKSMLRQMLGELRGKYASLTARALTDSAPIFEKAWAVEAGMGWIGRNSLLNTLQYGSSLLLGELLINCEVDIYDKPYIKDGCGQCTRCIEYCPNGAICPDRTINTTRCISRLTIEPNAPDSSLTLDDWVFGCDECQKCCPHNSRKPYYANSLFTPVIDPLRMDWGFCQRLTAEEFKRLFSGTPVERAGIAKVFEKIKGDRC